MSTIAALCELQLGGINVARDLKTDAKRQQLEREVLMAIVKTVEKRDGEAARNAMQPHISNAPIWILSNSAVP
ncbi:hypothetical protein G5B35_01645 [Parapusillimonas sp. SGNA-6]|nr:hypothetical protein [Parapusillimonas sp. SGNA-6]